MIYHMLYEGIHLQSMKTKNRNIYIYRSYVAQFLLWIRYLLLCMIRSNYGKQHSGIQWYIWIWVYNSNIPTCISFWVNKIHEKRTFWADTSGHISALSHSACRPNITGITYTHKKKGKAVRVNQYDFVKKMIRMWRGGTCFMVCVAGMLLLGVNRMPGEGCVFVDQCRPFFF